MYFKKRTPESVGVSSDEVLSFIKMLDDKHMKTHSVIMAKGDTILLSAIILR